MGAGGEWRKGQSQTDRQRDIHTERQTDRPTDTKGHGVKIRDSDRDTKSIQRKTWRENKRQRQRYKVNTEKDMA